MLVRQSVHRSGSNRFGLLVKELERLYWRAMTYARHDDGWTHETTELLISAMDAGLDAREALIAFTGFDIAIHQQRSQVQIAEFRVRFAASILKLIEEIHVATGVPMFAGDGVTPNPLDEGTH